MQFPLIDVRSYVCSVGKRRMSAFRQFVHAGRVAMQFKGPKVVRAVHRSEVSRRTTTSSLERYMADRVPYFYKEPAAIAESFGKGYFVSAIQEILLKLPTADSFRDSHFGEILAAVYAEEVLGLKRLYSKLALLTAENANAYKMDVLLYRPGCDPAQFVFAEVKSSMKTAADGLPPGHDKVCFKKLFTSLNDYSESDLRFDLAAIGERFPQISQPDRDIIANSLLPHNQQHVEYAAFCVIDHSTHDDRESRLLATRSSNKVFEVDLLCVAELPDVVDGTYSILGRARGV